MVELTAFDPAAGMAEATCRGWSRLRTLHRRRYRIGDREVEIVDTVEGPARRVRMRLPLAPGWRVELSCGGGDAGAGAGGPAALCRADDGEGAAVAIELPADFAWRLEPGTCHPSFGRELERPVLVGDGIACAGARTLFRRLD